MSYKLLLIGTNGDHFTDGKGMNLTVEQCREISAEMGSQNFFYPFHFIVLDKGPVYGRQRIIEAPGCLEHLKGKTVNKVKDYLREHGNGLMKTD